MQNHLLKISIQVSVIHSCCQVSEPLQVLSSLVCQTPASTVVEIPTDPKVPIHGTCVKALAAHQQELLGR